MPVDRTNVTVMRGGACGDFVLTLPAIDALRQAFPGTDLHLKGVPDIVRLAHPDRILDHHSASLFPLYTCSRPLPAATRALFARTCFVLCYAVDPEGVLESRLGELVGRNCLLCDPRPVPGRHLHVVDHLLQPLHRHGIAVSDPVPRIRLRGEDRTYAELLWRQLRLQPPVVALHPGSGGRRKCWPQSRFLDLADQLQRRGCRILVLHGEAEEDLAATLQERLPPNCHLLQPPRLLDLAALIDRADLFIGNDSGPGHVAAAVGTPTVSIFGPTDPQIWAPRGPAARFIQAPGGLLRELSTAAVLEESTRCLQGG